jgi:hypothetical protein
MLGNDEVDIGEFHGLRVHKEFGVKHRRAPSCIVTPVRCIGRNKISRTALDTGEKRGRCANEPTMRIGYLIRLRDMYPKRRPDL